MKKITCVCPTHGRAHIIGEAVESFLRQIIPGRHEVELLIVNDCPEQPLECNAPGVRVVNLPEPIPDASLKFNAAVELADCDLVAWWEDDDISLPSRLLWSIAAMEAGGLAYYKPATAFFWNGRFENIFENLFFGGGMFRRLLWDRAKGATPGDWADRSAHDNMAAAAGRAAVFPKLPPEKNFFVYRWGGPVHHDSGIAGTNADRFAAFRSRTLAHPLFRPGPQIITPLWMEEYEHLAAEWIAKGGA